MITTNNLKRKPLGKPQRLTVLTTSKVKPKDPEAILAGIKAQQDVLARQVNARPTRKVTGPMLVIGGMEDRVMNQTRKLLREKVRALRRIEAERMRIKIEGPVVATQSQSPKVEIPPEPPQVFHSRVSFPIESVIDRDVLEVGKVIIGPPEKKKRGRPKKEDKETE